ncbi:MAG: hydroxyphenylacetyl-CoA thioesterase PaaI [Gammaproteobacteria bacterium]|nr:hydroxyphenylacetyl-CoA thioesterase PaaI [Gammaproteobacteria bacterium]
MWQNDRTTQSMGMKIISVAPGEAVLTMTVQEHMLNGQGSAHGGMLFTMADSCFGFACNTYNQFAVAQQCSINYVAPGKLGDVLTATGREVHRAGRGGVYDIEIRNQDNTLIALFRGTCRTVKGQHLPEEIHD